MHLEKANIFGRSRVRRPAQEGGEVPDVANVVLLGRFFEPARRHVVDHALTQWADGLVGLVGLVEQKRKLLSRMGLNPAILRQAQNFAMPFIPRRIPTAPRRAYRESGLVLGLKGVGLKACRHFAKM